MQRAITVTPISHGWRIQSTTREGDAFFRSGAHAEAAAHAIAAEIANAGDTAVIEIFLRDGALGGRFVHAPYARDRTLGVGAVGAFFPGSAPAGGAI